MLTMKDIIRDGHPTLRQKAAELELPFTKEEKETLIAMREFLVNSQDEEIRNNTVYVQALVWLHLKLIFLNV